MSLILQFTDRFPILGRPLSATQRFFALNGPQHAAAMAYFALLALVPAILLLAGALARLALESPEAGDGVSTLDQVLQPLEAALPTFRGEVRKVIVTLASNQTSINWVSAFTLFFAAGGAFSALERGVNAILGTVKRRHFFGTRFLLAGMILTLALSLFLWRVISTFIPRVLATLHLEIPSWLFSNPVMEVGIQWGVTALGFYLLIRFLSTERFPRRARWTGAISFGILFHVARLGLDVFLEQTPLQQVYGTAMAFIGMVLWLYIISVILLACCALIHTLARESGPQISAEQNTEI